jgi:hypothetical protein
MARELSARRRRPVACPHGIPLDTVPPYVRSIMIDPLYAKIVAGLENLSEGDKFEGCANSLMRNVSVTDVGKGRQRRWIRRHRSRRAP